MAILIWCEAMMSELRSPGRGLHGWGPRGKYRCEVSTTVHDLAIHGTTIVCINWGLIDFSYHNVDASSAGLTDQRPVFLLIRRREDASNKLSLKNSDNTEKDIRQTRTMHHKSKTPRSCAKSVDTKR
jgi:hypothetical protein